MREVYNRLLSFRHIHDRSICENQHDIVNCLALNFQTVNVLQKFAQQRCEVGRTAELYLPLSRSVRLNNVCNPLNFRVRRISVQGETMTCCAGAHMGRDATEAKDRELLVCVVWLND
jgi:hypothetical protein